MDRSILPFHSWGVPGCIYCSWCRKKERNCPKLNCYFSTYFCWCARPHSGFVWKRSRINNSTWIKFKMASRLTLLRNLTFRRNVRLLCSQVRRSLVPKSFFALILWNEDFFFFQNRPSLARTRSILPQASFHLNAISFDKVTSRLLKKSCPDIFFFFLRISLFLFRLNLQRMVNQGQALRFLRTTSGLFEHSSISWT